MFKRQCTRSVSTTLEYCYPHQLKSLTFVLVLRDIREVGALITRTTTWFPAWCLLNEIARELDRTIDVSTNGKGYISQARTFAANRALVTVIRDHRAQIAKRDNHQGYVQ